MLYRITGGLFLLALGANYLVHTGLSPIVLGILGVVAGVALLAGV